MCGGRVLRLGLARGRKGFLGLKGPRALLRSPGSARQPAPLEPGARRSAAQPAFWSAAPAWAAAGRRPGRAFPAVVVPRACRSRSSVAETSPTTGLLRLRGRFCCSAPRRRNAGEASLRRAACRLNRGPLNEHLCGLDDGNLPAVQAVRQLDQAKPGGPRAEHPRGHDDKRLEKDDARRPLPSIDQTSSSHRDKKTPPHP